MKILGEHNLRIIQNLMALPGRLLMTYMRLDPILLPWHNAWTFLNQFPSWTLIESDDTAGSARQ